MKRRILLFVILGMAGGAAWAASPLYVTPDVPTFETVSGNTMMPWQIYRYDGTAPSYTLALTVPGNPSIGAIHKMDGLGDWLFSVRAPSNLGGALTSTALPRDVISYDGSTGTYSVFFCGASQGIPPRAKLDAVYLEGGDQGSLVVSFDVPITLGPFTFDPADLVQFAPTGGVGCGAWLLVAANPVFDASISGFGILTSRNLLDADRSGNGSGGVVSVLSFDVPTFLGPPGGTFVPGQLVAWNGGTFTLFEALAGWPANLRSHVEGISCLANPGAVPNTLMVVKSTMTVGDLTLSWTASCSQGGEDYGIYQGTIGSYYSHTMIDCTDGGVPLTEEVTPPAGSTYYLVVPHHTYEEGSYGKCSSGVCLPGDERPVGAATCVSPQVVTPCPP